MSVDRPTVERYCSALGCRSMATAVVDHPDHGERFVCEDDARDFPVVRNV